MATEWGRACDDIATIEFDLVSLQNERLKLSPRAVQQGWVKELDSNVAAYRKKLTAAKANGLFEVASALRTMRSQKEQHEEQLEDLREERKQVYNSWLREHKSLIDV